jgi:choline dehydrogenase
MAAKTYDYIIVGSGSAGSTIAGRVSARPENRVLVLEAGPPDYWWNWKVHMPAAFPYCIRGDAVNWDYRTEPEPFMNNRVMNCPRGRVLGGSSSINGLVYIRGHALDYERWAQAGNRGWSYAEVLPYFKRAESRVKGANEYRGGDGPLRVSWQRTIPPLYNAWIEGARQAGYPITDDVNGFQQEGIGPYEMTSRNGRRWSAARAYLHPAMGRPNLAVETRALARRVLFEGKRAVGVEYEQGGEVRQARAEREVVLCGGAINSPQLLMLSGVGNADELKPLGIPVVQHLPGVGQNLQDHIECYVQMSCKQPITLYSRYNLWGKMTAGAEWLFLGTGWGASNHYEAGGFIRTRPGVEQPDIQYHFFPMAINPDGTVIEGGHGFQAHMGPMRPTSRGWIKLRSANPRDKVRIQFNYMSTAQDRQEFRDGVRLTREIFAQKAFDPFRGAELAPGPGVQSDADIDAFLRAHAETAYHPSSSCKMGTDSMAVVDPELKLHGLEGLRVADASIMPSVISGNLNAPTIMIGEKCSDMMLGNPPLPRLDLPYYVNPDWATKQR